MTRAGARWTCTAVVAAALMIAIGSAAVPVSPPTDDEALLEAAKRSDRDAVRSLLAKGADINAQERDGTTALHWAVRASDVVSTRLLLRAGARVNAANRYGVTPLSLAAANGDVGIVSALLEAGADANATTPSGETALMTASRTGNADAVTLLLDYGADVSAREHGFGETAVMWAVAENHPAVVRLLHAYGADVNAAAHALEFPNVKVDIATMVITALPRGGLTALMYAARQGSLDSANALVDMGANLNAIDPDGTTALVVAIVNAHYDVATMLAQRGADPNVADVTGMAAVYATVDMHSLDPLVNRPPPPGNTSRAAVDLVELLLRHRADPDAALKSPLLARQHNAGDPTLGAGATPLMRAAKNGDVDMMSVLLAHGGDVNRAMSSGMTPLLFAATASRRKPARSAVAAAELCIEHGANVNAADATGQTALHLAVGTSDDLVKYLADHGARLDVKDQFGRTPLDIAMGVAGGGRGGGGRGGAPVIRESTAALLRQLAARGADAGNSRPSVESR